MAQPAPAFEIAGYRSAAWRTESRGKCAPHGPRRRLKSRGSGRCSFAPPVYLLFHALDTHLSKTIERKISTSSTLEQFFSAHKKVLHLLLHKLEGTDCALDSLCVLHQKASATSCFKTIFFFYFSPRNLQLTKHSNYSNFSWTSQREFSLELFSSSCFTFYAPAGNVLIARRALWLLCSCLHCCFFALYSTRLHDKELSFTWDSRWRLKYFFSLAQLISACESEKSGRWKNTKNQFTYSVIDN